MNLAHRSGGPRTSIVAACIAATMLSLAATAWGWQPGPSKAVAERIKRDAARCKHTGNLETCDDAVRWDPSDPALLVAFGDALLRTQRAAQALRQYQRAVALAPKMPGVGAKISAAEARVHNTHAQGKPTPKSMLTRNVPLAPVTSFTNDAVDTHSH